MSRKEQLALLLYNLILALVVPFMFVHWLVKTATGNKDYGRPRLSRFGIIDDKIQSTELLIHCVSVGESNVAISVVKQLLKTAKPPSITITTTTATGAENVKKQLGDKVQHLYLPIDMKSFMRRFLDRIAPDKVWIVEVELWPNMINLCFQRRIPISVVNGRMTDRSVERYLKFKSLFTPMLRKLFLVCVQSQRDYTNYLALGMPVNRCIMTGNIKFDMMQRQDPDPNLKLLLHNRACLVAGSTHEPEETLMLEALSKLKPKHKKLLLVLVPRHPERFDKVEQLCQASPYKTYRFSAIEHASLPEDCDVLLVDKMGVLNSFYSAAQLAFVGGSFAKRGGHNALEPAVWSVPVIMGPHTYNNPEITIALRNQGSLKIAHDLREFVESANGFLTNEDSRRFAGHAGIQVINNNRGAINQTIALIG